MKKVLMVIVAMFGIIAMSNAATTAATEMGMPTDYAGTISGTIANGKLVYDVKCLATWLGIPFDTAVTFEGNE